MQKIWFSAFLFPFLVSCSISLNSQETKQGSADSGALAIKPSKCEGKVSPICVESGKNLYRKIYPKYDPESCAAYPYTDTKIMDPSLCVIPKDLESFAQSVLPAGAEVLSVSLGLNYEKKIYFIQYRAGDEMLQKIVDESGQALPSDTPPDRLSFIGDQLRSLLEKEPFEIRRWISTYPLKPAHTAIKML